MFEGQGGEQKITGNKYQFEEKEIIAILSEESGVESGITNT
jgi:hypothetical protein